MARYTLLPLLIVLSLYGQVPLPRFDAEALSGWKLTMPAAVQGHPALLIVGFTHGSGPHCTDWAKRLESEFKANTEMERYTVISFSKTPRS